MQEHPRTVENQVTNRHVSRMMAWVSTHLGNTDAPVAARAKVAGWRDPRLWIGVALVASSVLVGARVVGGADESVEVWTARTDLAQGQQVQEDDLVATQVRLDSTTLYVRADRPFPDTSTLGRAVDAGELLPRSVLGAADEARDRVPLSIPPGGMEDGIRRGQLVDVWVSRSETATSGETVTPRKLFDDVLVLEVPEADSSLGATGNRQVLIGVSDASETDIGRVLGASRDGRVQITR